MDAEEVPVDQRAGFIMELVRGDPPAKGRTARSKDKETKRTNQGQLPTLCIHVS